MRKFYQKSKFSCWPIIKKFGQTLQTFVKNQKFWANFTNFRQKSKILGKLYKLSSKNKNFGQSLKTFVKNQKFISRIFTVFENNKILLKKVDCPTKNKQPIIK